MKTATRKGGWIQTFTGVAFYPLDPRPEDINIEDIAHALSLECRYGGHSKFHYSVAQHSVLIYLQAREEDKRSAILHDASEAYLKDICRPMKESMPDYKKWEASLHAMICRKFGCELTISPQLKEMDTRITFDEAATLLGPAPMKWQYEGEPLGVDIEPWWPSVAEQRFIECFYDAFPEHCK